MMTVNVLCKNLYPCGILESYNQAKHGDMHSSKFLYYHSIPKLMLKANSIRIMIQNLSTKNNTFSFFLELTKSYQVKT